MCGGRERDSGGVSLRATQTSAHRRLTLIRPVHLFDAARCLDLAFMVVTFQNSFYSLSLSLFLTRTPTKEERKREVGWAVPSDAEEFTLMLNVRMNHQTPLFIRIHEKSSIY